MAKNKFTDAELRNALETMGVIEAAGHLGSNYVTVKRRMKNLGLGAKVDARRGPVANTSDEELKKILPTMTRTEAS